MTHTFNLSTREAETGGWISVIEASLVYKASSRTTSTVTQRNSVSKKPKIKNGKKDQTFSFNFTIYMYMCVCIYIYISLLYSISKKMQLGDSLIRNEIIYDLRSISRI